MKALALLALGFTSTLAFAVTPAVVCQGTDGETYVSTLRNTNSNGFFDGECGEAVYHGTICYRGDRAAVVRILQNLANNDVMGDEMRLRNVSVSGTGVAYSIWDGPNEHTVGRRTISRCK